MFKDVCVKVYQLISRICEYVRLETITSKCGPPYNPRMSYTRQYLTGSFIHKTVIHHKASFQICKLIKHGVISKTIKCKYLVNVFIVSVPIAINILNVITYQYLDESGRVQLHGEFTPLKVTKGTLICRLKGFNT